MASRISAFVLLVGLTACGDPPHDSPDAARADAGSSVDAAPPDGGIVPLPDDGGPIRLVFLAPEAGREFTCADDEDGTLRGFGPIHIVIQVLNDPSHTVAAVVCQSSGGFTGYTGAAVADEAGARIARVDHLTGYDPGTRVTIGLRCEAHGADSAPVAGVPTTDRLILETIQMCSAPDGTPICGGC